MLKNTVIIALIILVIYLYYQQRKPHLLTGDNSDTSDTIRDLQTQLQQANQLETYNSEQLRNYETQVNRLKEQLKNKSEGDWETKTAETITELEKENEDLTQAKTSLQEQLNSILNKWNWGSWKPKSAEEFLNKFEPWINNHLESAEKLKTAEQQLVDSQREIERLKTEKETNEEIENLESERDEAIREKKEAEQENLSLGNKLKLKSQEADNKVKEIERLKKEKSSSEIALNKSLTEWKEKYSKQGKLLDEEQLESKKLEESNEKLQEKIKELEKTKMPGGWDYEEELEKELKEQEKIQAEQLKALASELTEETLPQEITWELVLELAKKKQSAIFSRKRKEKK